MTISPQKTFLEEYVFVSESRAGSERKTGPLTGQKAGKGVFWHASDAAPSLPNLDPAATQKSLRSSVPPDLVLPATGNEDAQG